MTTHDLICKYLYDCIYSSVKIEGLGMTYPQTLSILEGAPIEGATARDVLFVVNMKRAWKFLEDNKDYPVNVMLLREYNKICGNNLIDGCGVLRTGIVHIGGTRYIPPIPELSDVVDSVSKITSISDPIERAIEMFLYISKAQLFIDGNKRVSQLVANHILVSEDVGIMRIPDTGVLEFTTALLKHYEGESEELRNYLLKECLIKSSNSEYVEYKGERFSVDEVCNSMPGFVVGRYASRLECAKDNVERYYRILCGEG